MPEMEKANYELPAGPSYDWPIKCQMCGDSGIVIYEIPREVAGQRARRDFPWHKYRLPWDDIGMKPETVRFAAPCTCQTNTARFSRLRASGIPEEFSVASLDSARPHQKEIAAQLKNYAKVVLSGSKDGRIFAMMGETGKGKTYLAVACLNLIIANGGSGRFITADAFCDRLRDNALSAVESDIWVKGMKGEGPHLVILDELGAERAGTGDSVISARYGAFLKSFDGKGYLLTTTNFANIESALQGILGADGIRVARRLGDNLYNKTVKRLS